MLVFVEGAAESVVAQDAEPGDLVWVVDRFGERMERGGAAEGSVRLRRGNRGKRTVATPEPRPRSYPIRPAGSNSWTAHSFGISATSCTPLRKVETFYNRHQGGQELPPGRRSPPRCRAKTGCGQDPADGALPHPMAQADQLALDSPVSPSGILLGQSDDQVTHRSGIGGLPGLFGYLQRCLTSPVPGQQGARRHDPMCPQPLWKLTGERGQDRPVGPIRSRTRDLTAQHRHLMPQHEDFHLLGGIAASHQHQPPHDPDQDQIQQTETHGERE
ncbi:MAG: hypothetical protein JWN52_6633 [Actinomycetia bacterium]|nr:hypothetical protein [Actinomycetes bacterium]